MSPVTGAFNLSWRHLNSVMLMLEVCRAAVLFNDVHFRMFGAVADDCVWRGMCNALASGSEAKNSELITSVPFPFQMSRTGCTH